MVTNASYFAVLQSVQLTLCCLILIENLRIAIKLQGCFPGFTTIERQFPLGLSYFCTSVSRALTAFFVDCLIKDISIMSINLSNKEQICLSSKIKIIFLSRTRGGLCQPVIKDLHFLSLEVLSCDRNQCVLSTHLGHIIHPRAILGQKKLIKT